MTDALKLLPCPFCGGEMQPRWALWPSDGDFDAVIHAQATDCPTGGFSDGSADRSIVAKWNARSPSAAARVLLDSPEAVERMVEAAWGAYGEDCREGMGEAITAALRSIAGEEPSGTPR